MKSTSHICQMYWHEKKEFCRHPSCQRAHIVWLQECGAFGLMASNNLMFSFRANKPKQGTNSWWSIYFLAATKQLLEQFSLYVSPSACDTFVTMFLSSHHFEIFSSYYHWQKWYPYKSSMSEVKGQGHRGENKFCPNLGVSIPYLHFEFTDSHEIMHKASSSMGDKPYYFSRLSINFQSHRGQKTSISTLIECFWTVTPVWFRLRLWNDVQSLK